MWLFKPKPKPPIQQASALLHDVTEIAYRYKRDKSHIPSEEEVAALWALHQQLWETRCTIEYIARNMEARRNGEPEGAAKFRDKEVMDWHYPE